MSGLFEGESPAQKKRRPFRIKSGDSSHNIYCVQHADEIATFYCALCHKANCETCVGEERGEQTVCASCITSKEQGEVKKQTNKRRARLLLWWVFGGAAAIVVTINIYLLISSSPSSEGIKEPQVSSQVSLLLECRHRLEALVEYARYFHETMQQLPASMEDVAALVEDKTILLDPVTSKPYLISIENDRIRVVCPHPEAHGLADLFAEPRQPAKMVLVQ